MHFVIRLFSTLFVFFGFLAIIAIVINLRGMTLGYAMMTLGIAIMSHLLVDSLYEMRKKK